MCPAPFKQKDAHKETYSDTYTAHNFAHTHTHRHRHAHTQTCTHISDNGRDERIKNGVEAAGAVHDTIVGELGACSLELAKLILVYCGGEYVVSLGG